MWNKYQRFPVWYVVALGILLLLAGCSHKDVQAVADLIPLQRQLDSEYGASGTRCHLLDANTLDVTLVNSPSNSPDSEQKAERAREVAEFACQSYVSMDRIARVRVAFAIAKKGALADATATISFHFDKNELECGDG